VKKYLMTACAVVLIQNVAFATPKPSYNWAAIQDGVNYARIVYNNGDNDTNVFIHAFQIDPSKVSFDVLVAGDTNPQGLSAKSFAKNANANLVINGGFFTEEHKSIGLLVRSGKILNPKHNTSWWSIFGIKNSTPFITKLSDYVNSDEVLMAVQAGPRLVIDGEIPKLKPGISIRSAVGITKDNKVMIVITDGSLISLNELAQRMKLSRYEHGLECIQAMALDGGSSSQLYAKIGEFEFSISGLVTVPNAIAVYTKEK